MINIKRTGGVCTPHSSTPHKTSTQASILIANPFGRSAIAYVAGIDGEGWKCITPMQTIKYKQPRTAFVTLGVA